PRRSDSGVSRRYLSSSVPLDVYPCNATTSGAGRAGWYDSGTCTVTCRPPNSSVPVPLDGRAGGASNDGPGSSAELQARVTMTAAAAVMARTARHPCRAIAPPSRDADPAYLLAG